MEYNKHTIFNRKKRCELEETMDSWIPYIGYKAKMFITNELMDDDAVKVMKAFDEYCESGKEPGFKDELLSAKFDKLVALRKLGKDFIDNTSKLLKND